MITAIPGVAAASNEKIAGLHHHGTHLRAMASTSQTWIMSGGARLQRGINAFIQRQSMEGAQLSLVSPFLIAR